MPRIDPRIAPDDPASTRIVDLMLALEKSVKATQMAASSARERPSGGFAAPGITIAAIGMHAASFAAKSFTSEPGAWSDYLKQMPTSSITTAAPIERPAGVAAIQMRAISVRLEGLEHELLALKKKLVSLAQDHPFALVISTLAPEPYTLTRDIPVVVEPSGDDCIATFYDAGVTASGDNGAEAVANLKDMLISEFELLTSLPNERLGPEPLRKLAVLREFIRRSD